MHLFGGQPMLTTFAVVKKRERKVIKDTKLTQKDSEDSLAKLIILLLMLKTAYLAIPLKIKKEKQENFIEG